MACVSDCIIPGEILVLSGGSPKVIVASRNGQQVCFYRSAKTECCATGSADDYDECPSCDECPCESSSSSDSSESTTQSSASMSESSSSSVSSSSESGQSDSSSSSSSLTSDQTSQSSDSSSSSESTMAQVCYRVSGSGPGTTDDCCEDGGCCNYENTEIDELLTGGPTSWTADGRGPAGSSNWILQRSGVGPNYDWTLTNDCQAGCHIGAYVGQAQWDGQGSHTFSMGSYPSLTVTAEDCS